MNESQTKGFDRPLSVCDELREELGLDEDESLRLLRQDERTILVEHLRETSGFAIRWDRGLVLSANVRAFPLADVLSMLHRSGKSGFLLFGFSDHEKAVYMHRGEVVFAASNQGVDRLGECRFRNGMLTLEQLRDAEQRWTPSERIGNQAPERRGRLVRLAWIGELHFTPHTD